MPRTPAHYHRANAQRQSSACTESHIYYYPRHLDREILRAHMTRSTLSSARTQRRLIQSRIAGRASGRQRQRGNQAQRAPRRKFEALPMPRALVQRFPCPSNIYLRGSSGEKTPAVKREAVVTRQSAAQRQGISRLVMVPHKTSALQPSPQCHCRLTNHTLSTHRDQLRKRTSPGEAAANARSMQLSCAKLRQRHSQRPQHPHEGHFCTEDPETARSQRTAHSCPQSASPCQHATHLHNAHN